MNQKSKLEILEETIEFYSNNPRSFNEEEGFCMYVDKYGNNCAFARCCTEEGKNLLHSVETGCQSLTLDEASELLHKEVDDFLKDEYKGHSKHFWVEVQALHDDENNWDVEYNKKNRLSEEGVKRIKLIKEHIISNQI